MAVKMQQVLRWKQEQRPIAVLTAWDVISGNLADQAGADLILVGDSLAMVALGYDTTLPLTLEEMIHHGRAVRRGVRNALLVMDLPFMSYQASVADALRSAGRALKEAEVQAVKVEGGYPVMADTIHALVQAGIPVMGHVGLTPQSVNVVGGFRRQGTSPESAERILQEAIAIERAGAFAIVLEHIPPTLAQTITAKLTIPTIGIGAGPDCDGQVLVTADVLGLSDWHPPFAKSYADLRQVGIAAAKQFCEEVRSRQFPTA
ncbi:3-methyl-2-oxobutanoate hydroxymethyltransferase [Leptolyngbya sp. PCC 6406]|uniref:3-methyl-2-oxobutanoate hydroxymethyltransferase n=1 Tax=Leptolyngbya sp. PCC 6406 TaxID=1173264 RepID=UPI0002AC056A|nr:3-methyl-2-oxobutanoate hydroxymethyltransferase [Leptolyngbya sp. PCC 6406]